jgi:hypothetical protein
MKEKIKNIIKNKLNVKLFLLMKRLLFVYNSIINFFYRIYKITQKRLNTIKFKTCSIIQNNYPTKIKTAYSFAILCIKKTAYADMIFYNVNSLHFINPHHKINIYCDKICYEYIINNKNNFNYLEKIKIINHFSDTSKAWQYYKIEVHILASKNDQIDTDADEIWHKDPLINTEKITTFLKQRKMSDSKIDTAVIKNIFAKNDWIKFNHYVASFVSIPSKFMTKKIEDDMRKINDIIFTNNLNFIENQDDKVDTKRLSEQYAVNFALQSNCPQNIFRTLESGGLESKETLEALSYGYLNNVIE